MRSAVFTAPFNFEIQERERPSPAPGEALVRIMASGICGSDIGPYRGKDLERRQPGIVMGHEAAGIVEAVSPDVLKWRPGDRVAINPQISCRECGPCTSGSPNLCDGMLLIGSSKRKFLDGCMCEYICLPERQLIKIPDGVSFEDASLLDPLGNAVRVMRRAGVKLGDTVAVLGCGTIGLLAVQTARLAGACRVIVVDISDRKLETAKELGADVCVNPGRDGGECLSTLESCADVSVEAAGSPQTYALAAKLCRKGGTIAALGYSGNEMNLPLSEIIFKELNLSGSTGFAVECETVLRLLEQKRIKTDKIITHRFPLEDINRGFETVTNPEENAIKVIIQP